MAMMAQRQRPSPPSPTLSQPLPVPSPPRCHRHPYPFVSRLLYYTSSLQRRDSRSMVSFEDVNGGKELTDRSSTCSIKKTV
ncbi:hypothetical protein LOK49_LG08G01849 [Camellia lanceoleosa]|uniref:Uncharacterized protein n=1 Tax=Camellia lanceoleosa TaxID=1840588 RepID=A0ACC0GUT9_9ERIC|nr:hypothetical protein LOK49_LG08G01849 [Camellia lanceoleosa]